MKIYSVFDEEFANYGQVLKGYDTAGLIAAMNKIPLPADGVDLSRLLTNLKKRLYTRNLRIKHTAECLLNWECAGGIILN